MKGAKIRFDESEGNAMLTKPEFKPTLLSSPIKQLTGNSIIYPQKV